MHAWKGCLPQLPARSLFLVIPAQAGIQESRGAVVKGRQILPDARVRLSCLLSFPQGGNGLLNHWIPACAGMTGSCGQAFVRNSEEAVRMATNPFPAPPSFQRRPACMDAGGRAASGTGRRGGRWRRAAGNSDSFRASLITRPHKHIRIHSFSRGRSVIILRAAWPCSGPSMKNPKV